MKLRTVIVDDEPLAREKLRRFLEMDELVELCGEAGNGEDAIRLVAELKPDLLFLDIQMPEPNGLEVLKILKEEWLPATVFTTAHAEHAVKAFELKAVDYLLKPYTKDRLKESLKRVREQVGRGQAGASEGLRDLVEKETRSAPVERFLVKANERYVLVRSSEIVWAEAAANYVVLHTASGIHVHRSTMSGLENDLDAKRFFRSSRSTIVNLERIKEVQAMAAGEHVIILDNGQRVPMTRGLKELQERL